MLLNSLLIPHKIARYYITPKLDKLHAKYLQGEKMNGNAALWFVDRHVSEVAGPKLPLKKLGAKAYPLI